MTFEGFPLVVGWELTLACNLRCRHCASSAGAKRPRELSLEEALAICDQFPLLLVQEVDFTGGEPLLRKDWPSIAGRLTELEIPIRMVTNGLLLEQSVTAVADANICTLGISLDGLRETHDGIREYPGLFERVVRGVAAAREAEIPVGIITAVNDANVDELPRLVAFIQSLGVRHWQIQPTFSLGRAKEHGKALSLSPSSFMKLGQFVHDNLTRLADESFTLMPADGVGYYTELDTRSPAWRGCSAGRASCGITADGRIKGCLSMPDDLTEGDLRQRDLWEIWFNEESFSYNRVFSKYDLGEHCASCDMGESCMGGCAVMSHAATGRFHNDPFCFKRIAGHGAKHICKTG